MRKEKPMRNLPIAAAALVAASLASAQENPRSLSAEDFLRIGARLAGQRVLITGCSISRASAAYVYCSRPGRLAAIYLDGQTMNHKSLEEAVKHCASASLEPQCAAVVAGFVHQAPGQPQIHGAFILWQAVERAGKWSMAAR